MLGPVVNSVVIVVCGLAGCFLVRKIPERFEDIIKKAIGLSIILVGIKGALTTQRELLLIMSMVSGAALGELINIDRFMNSLGMWVERKLGNSGGKRSFSKGFVAASILFGSGSMAIMGSLQSGLTGNHEILFMKSILDGSVSIVFGASMGIGVAFSALPLFVYQGGLTLAAVAVRDLLTADTVREMSAVGSLVVAAIGFNFLGTKEIKVANLIPAIFIPLIVIVGETLFR